MASDKSVIIRPATIRDMSAMARIAAKTFGDTSLDEFLSPHRHQYPADHGRIYEHRRMRCFLDPRNRSFVACSALNPQTVVGYVQLARLGDDEGAQVQIRGRQSLWLTLQSLYYWAKFQIVDYLWPNKAVDLDHFKQFREWIALDEQLHFSHEALAARWYVQSLVVLEEWQMQGIGKRLMKEAFVRAQQDGVPVCLEASAQGEMMYRKLGFQLLGRFSGHMETKGGIMIWRSEKPS
ncbi:MAG: hypothetical protein M1818_006343 [Claussenomyces sp. TS43310]|nr:MAG: hypothetical protein M1818_006343 [Claussenomyces sp. TS43310]